MPIQKATIAGAFGALLMLLATPTESAVDHEALLRDRLTEVRELLERRQAHRRMLDQQIETLSSELDELNRERKEALETLSEQVDQTKGYELELDRLIPRILPRLNRLEKLRKNGAYAIADLAKIGRDGSVKSKTKSRLLAAKTVSIDQMRRASTSVRLLRRAPAHIIGQHRDLNFQIPLLATALDRASSQQDQLQRRRDNAIRNLANLNIDIERLTTEEHRLARNMLARTLSAEAQPAQNGQDHSFDLRPIGKTKLNSVTIKGAALGQTSLQSVTTSLDHAAKRGARPAPAIVPSMPGRGIDGQSSTNLASWSDRPLGKASISRVALANGRDVTTFDPSSFDGISSRVARGMVEGGEPLVPTVETIGYTLANGVRRTDQTAIEIPAAPRQRIAAPDDGLVVFAGDFRSYGLLLIIEHDSEYHTLLWGFSSLDIDLGDRVQAGQIIGSAGTSLSPKLHVELRQNGEPVSPEVWLAASNSGVKG